MAWCWKQSSVRSPAPHPDRQYVHLDETSNAMSNAVSVKTSLRAVKGPSVFERWKKGDFTIVPEKNAFLDVWDVVMVTAVLCTASILPYEVALLDNLDGYWDIMNRTIDVVFIMDIVLTFHVAYPVTAYSTSGGYEKSPWMIAQRYLAFPFSDNFEAGWFWPDMLTVFPWDLATQYVAPSMPRQRSARILSVFRLIRMLRLLRVVQLLNKWHASLGFSFAVFSLVKCLGFVVLFLHWLACLWGGIAALNQHSGAPTWLLRWAQAVGRPPEEVSHYEIYNLALYFASMTLTSVGYGDILPGSDIEVLVVTLMMVTTGFMWSFVLANAVNIVTNLDTYTSRFQDRMDELNLLMRARNVSPALRLRMRRYMHESFHVHRQRHQLQTIKWLSSGLQGELAIESGVAKVCGLVWYLRNLEEAVIVEIASLFQAEMFSTNEFISSRSKLFVIRKGTCMRKARILTRDAVIGEDMILVSDYLRDNAMARTLTFVEVLVLKRVDLLAAAEHHPQFKLQLRKSQMKLAIWRGVTYVSRQVKIKGSKWDKLWTEFQEQYQKANAARRRSSRQSTMGTWRSGSRYASDPGSVEEPRSHEDRLADQEVMLGEVLRELRVLRGASEAGLHKLDDLGVQVRELQARIGSLEQRAAAPPEPPAARSKSPRPPRAAAASTPRGGHLMAGGGSAGGAGGGGSPSGGRRVPHAALGA